MISKTLKESPRLSHRFTDPDDLPLPTKLVWYFREWFYYKPYSYFRRTLHKLARAYQYAAFSWGNYDWDMAYVYQILHFKLKRLYRELEHGHAVQEPETMKALRDLIKIVNRLFKGQYENKYIRQHEKKWGKIEHESLPIYDDNGKIKWYQWISWREKLPKNAPEELKTEERKENRVCYDNGELDRLRDIDKLAEILKKNAPHFWD